MYRGTSSLFAHSSKYTLIEGQLSSFLEILASTYGPLGPYGPGPFITPGPYLKKHRPTAHEHIANMLLEQCAFLRKFFQIMNGPGPWGPMVQDRMSRTVMVLDHKSRPKSPKSVLDRLSAGRSMVHFKRGAHKWSLHFEMYTIDPIPNTQSQNWVFNSVYFKNL